MKSKYWRHCIETWWLSLIWIPNKLILLFHVNNFPVYGPYQRCLLCVCCLYTNSGCVVILNFIYRNVIGNLSLACLCIFMFNYCKINNCMYIFLDHFILIVTSFLFNSCWFITESISGTEQYWTWKIHFLIVSDWYDRMSGQFLCNFPSSVSAIVMFTISDLFL